MKEKTATKRAVLAILASHGLRQYDYAKMIGVSASAITRMLNTPAKTFSLGRLAQMADLLGMSDAEILTVVNTLRKERQDVGINGSIPDEGSMEEPED